MCRAMAEGIKEAAPASKRMRTQPPGPRPKLRIGLVGLGAIGERVAEALRDGDLLPGAELAAVLVNRPRAERPPCCGPDVLVTTSLDEFFAADWTLCLEAAGQPWLREHARRVLQGSRDLLLTSVGALTDDALHRDLQELAATSGGRLLIAAGAMPAMDWMSAAALEHIEEIVLIVRKRPEGWLDTPAEAKVDLRTLTEPTTVFEGSARDAASLYPKNSNIAAALGFATVGLDSERLLVRLVADPTVTGPTQQINLKGAAGEISIQVKGTPLSQRTSRMTPLSVLKALRNLSSTEVIGV